MEKRANKILELLTLENRMEVSLLAEKLGVSQVTIRKDLDELEGRGIVLREHGFARLRSVDDIHGRIAYQYEEKLKIARRAAELVENDSVIMMESGSCCALLAEVLAAEKQGLTVLTNSAFLAELLTKKSDFQVVLFGGSYQRDSQVMVGPMVRQCAENFYAELFFFGTDGFSAPTGFTNRNQLRAQAVRDMALQARRAIVLTQSEKFSRRGTVPLNLKNGVHTLITDSRLPEDSRRELEARQIQILLAE